MHQSLHALLLPLLHPRKLSVPACISVTGAGGKSTLLEALGQILLAAGQQVLFCSTTKVWRKPQRPLLLAQALPETSPEYLAAECQRAFSKSRCVELAWAFCPASQPRQKLQGLNPELLTALYTHMAALPQPRPWLLVEADGAASHPLKAHAPHEPALPACTNVCIVCAGLDGLLSSPAPVSPPSISPSPAPSWPHATSPEGPGTLNERYVHRAALAATYLNLPLNSPLSPAHVAQLALCALGSFQGPAAFFLNKADLFPHAQPAAAAIALEIHAKAPHISCFLGSFCQGWCQVAAPAPCTK